MRLFEILFQELHSVCQGAEVFLCKRMHRRRKVERNIPCRRQCFENVSSQKTGPRTEFQHRKTSGIQGTQFLSDGIKELDAPRPFLRCGLSPCIRSSALSRTLFAIFDTPLPREPGAVSRASPAKRGRLSKTLDTADGSPPWTAGRSGASSLSGIFWFTSTKARSSESYGEFN